ncbi:MAG: KpsF/GutQ family sugar-phosphate isomerase [Kiritimatiellae bacterium]|nr:KpsF/GutQ family sugar-phosphate isomerase [Kiritimatiellia bacterium]
MSAQGEKDVSAALDVFEAELEGIRAVRDAVGDDFARAVALLRGALARGGKIVLTGVGKNRYIAEKISATLASTGSRSVFLDPMQALHGDLGILACEDILVALSYSGETDEIRNLMPAVRRLGIPVVAITAAAGSSLAHFAEVSLSCAVPREACPFGIAPTTSTTATLALGDAIAMALLRSSDFGRADFAKFHPGGAIGQTLLLRARDIMRTGERLAAVAPETTLADVVVKMTHTRSGAAFAVSGSGKLLGIFTDGDFRRALAGAGALALSRKVADFMTAKPVTIAPDDFAADVLRVLEGREIDDLPVVDPETGVLVGAVDIQDLPKFKIL